MTATDFSHFLDAFFGNVLRVGVPIMLTIMGLITLALFAFHYIELQATVTRLARWCEYLTDENDELLELAFANSDDETEEPF